MDAMLLVESNMMAAATFGLDGIPKEPIVTIASVGREEQKAEKPGTKGERWGIVRFAEPWAKPYKVNSTARKALILMFGRETDKWVGKRIQLYGLPGNYYNNGPGVAVRIKGSPDITEPISFQMKAFGGGKNTYNLVVVTGAGAPVAQRSSAPAAATTAAAATAPAKSAAASDTTKAAPVARKPDVAPSSSTAAAAPAPAPAPSSPAADAPPVDAGFAPGFLGPRFYFGDHKGKSIEHASDGALLGTVQLGETKMADNPGAEWVKSVADNITLIRLEIERRYKAKMAKEDREPGADDGEEPAAVDKSTPPF